MKEFPGDHMDCGMDYNYNYRRTEPINNGSYNYRRTDSTYSGGYFHSHTPVGGLSAFWSKWTTKHKDPEKIALDLIQIKEAVASLLKIHGVPDKTKIEFGNLMDLGKKASDHISRTITLDKQIYDIAKVDEVMDTYCGAALQLASRLNHTRKLNDRLSCLNELDPQALFERLLEDKRVENLARLESPGYSNYFETAKKVLYLDQEFGKCLNKWGQLAETDKVLAIIFASIRIPKALKAKQKTWKTLKGHQAYELVQKILQEKLVTESDVATVATHLKSLWLSLFNEYEQLIGKKDVEKDLLKQLSAESKISTSQIASMLNKQDKANRSDANDMRSAKGLRDRAKTTGHELLKSAPYHDGDRDKKIEAVLSAPSKVQNDQERKYRDLKNDENEMSKNRDGRFGLIEIERILGRTDVVKSGLNLAELKELSKAESEKVTVSKWETGGDDGYDRKNVVIHPQITPEAIKNYDHAFKAVSDVVANMKAVFRLRLGTKRHVVTELTEGRLHRKMLSKAFMVDRVFTRSYVKKAEGLSIALLLDESGSMGTTSTPRNKAFQALSIAVCCAEALKSVQGVELEVYSYGSNGSDDENNLVKILYGKDNPNIKAIGGYVGSTENYDHAAIQVATKMLLKNATNEKKMMIIISDGTPQGRGYSGTPAMNLTRQAALDAEKKGIYVLHIGIENFESERMFKHTLKYTDLTKLTQQMRNLIVSIVNSIS